jgi:hypothetical protein
MQQRACCRTHIYIYCCSNPADVEVVMTLGFLLTALGNCSHTFAQLLITFVANLYTVCVIAGEGLSPISGMNSLFLLLQGGVSLTSGFYGLSIATELLTSTETSLCMLLETILGPVIVYLGGYDSIPPPAIWGGIVIIISLAVNRYFLNMCRNW